MATTERERALTYEPDDTATLPELDGLTGVARVGTEHQHLEAVYFDTPALALAAAGITVRRRTGGDDAGWHLRLPDGAGTCREVRVPLSRASRSVPKPLRRAVLVHTRDAELTPIATLHTRRHVSRLEDGDGTVLAEVREDAVEAHLDRTDDAREAAAEPGATWREWTVVLGAGRPELLDRLGAVLHEAGGTPPLATTGLARALEDRVAADDTGEEKLRRKGPARHVVHRRLRQQVRELRRLDPQVRSDVPDSVHQMRVAIRRLRSALASFRPLLDRDRTDPVRDELKWLAAELGAARDVEVVQGRLLAAVDAEPAVLVDARVRRSVVDHGTHHYQHAHHRAVAAMESDRYLDLVDALDQLVADPPWTPRADRPAREVLPKIVTRDFKRVRRSVAAAEQSETHEERDTNLHEVRKAAKRARYAAETLVPVHGEDARRFATAMKRVQSTLGDHHDTVVARAVLRELADPSSASAEHAFAYGRLHAAEEARAHDLEARYERAWGRASRPKLRRWLS